MEIFIAVSIYLGIGLALLFLIGQNLTPWDYILWPVFWPFIILDSWLG